MTRTKPPADVLPKRLRAARIAAGLTQRDLEGRSKMGKNHVSAIESGRRAMVTADVVVRLARALGCSTDWLLGVE